MLSVTFKVSDAFMQRRRNKHTLPTFVVPTFAQNAKAGHPSNSTATTAADGTFHDVPFGVCGNGAFPNVTATQFITIIMPDGSAPGVRGQTFTLTDYPPGTEH